MVAPVLLWLVVISACATEREAITGETEGSALDAAIDRTLNASSLRVELCTRVHAEEARHCVGYEYVAPEQYRSSGNEELGIGSLAYLPAPNEPPQVCVDARDPSQPEIPLCSSGDGNREGYYVFDKRPVGGFFFLPFEVLKGIRRANHVKRIGDVYIVMIAPRESGLSASPEATSVEPVKVRVREDRVVEAEFADKSFIQTFKYSDFGTDIEEVSRPPADRIVEDLPEARPCDAKGNPPPGEIACQPIEDPAPGTALELPAPDEDVASALQVRVGSPTDTGNCRVHTTNPSGRSKTSLFDADGRCLDFDPAEFEVMNADVDAVVGRHGSTDLTITLQPPDLNRLQTIVSGAGTKAVALVVFGKVLAAREAHDWHLDGGLQAPFVDRQFAAAVKASLVA